MEIWQRLEAHHGRVGARRILDLFDGKRAGDFSARADGLLFDYSKTNIDAEARRENAHSKRPSPRQIEDLIRGRNVEAGPRRTA